MTDIMIDIETLGTTPGAVVLSVGAAVFDRDTGRTREYFYREISIRSSVQAGLQIDPDTLIWWMGQPDNARSILGAERQNDARSLAEAAQSFCMWGDQVGMRTAAIWTRGDMDLPVVGHALRVCGYSLPWSFWNYRDVRTALDVLGVRKEDYPPRGDDEHHAMADVVHQIQCMSIAFGRRAAE